MYYYRQNGWHCGATYDRCMLPHASITTLSTNDLHMQLDTNYRHNIILSVATSNSAVT